MYVQCIITVLHVAQDVLIPECNPEGVLLRVCSWSSVLTTVCVTKSHVTNFANTSL